MHYFVPAIVLLAIFIILAGVKFVPQGREGTVERFGRRLLSVVRRAPEGA